MTTFKRTCKYARPIWSIWVYIVFVVNTLESHNQNFKTIKHVCFCNSGDVWQSTHVQHSTNKKNKKKSRKPNLSSMGFALLRFTSRISWGGNRPKVFCKKPRRFLFRKTCLAADLSNPQVVCFQQSVKRDVFIQTSKLDQKLTSQLKSSCRKLIHKLLYFCHFWESMEITKDLHCRVGESIHLLSSTMKFPRQTL